MKREKAGPFITIKGLIEDITEYQTVMNGFMGDVGQFPLWNQNGDYVYVKMPDFSMDPGVDPVTIQFRICSANDLIQK